MKAASAFSSLAAPPQAPAPYMFPGGIAHPQDDHHDATVRFAAKSIVFLQLNESKETSSTQVAAKVTSDTVRVSGLSFSGPAP